MTEEASRATRQLPLIIGGLCVAAGILVGVWPDDEDSDGGAPTAVPTATATTTTTAVPSSTAVFEEGPVPDYVEPDLSGPDVGEVVVANAVDAAGLAVVGNELWWLSTEGATLAHSRLDGGEPTIVFTPEAPAAVGGALAVGKKYIFFSVPEEGVIYRVSREPSAKPEVFVTASSPEPVVVAGDEVWWVDGGSVWRSPTEESKPKRTAKLMGSVTSMAARADGVAWLSAPIEPSDGHTLAGNVNGVNRAAQLTPAERDSLVAADGVMFWAETRPTETGEHGHLVRRPDDQRPRTLRVSGLISHLAVAGERLIWTEIYVEKETSLLFASTLDGEDATRLGRIPGFVTAITVHEGTVYWSGPRGIERLRLAEE